MSGIHPTLKLEVNITPKATKTNGKLKKPYPEFLLTLRSDGC